MSAVTSKRTKLTYLYDCIRGPFNGIIYTGLMTMAMLVAIREHHAPDWAKSFIASAEAIGRIFTPLSLYLGFRIGHPTGRLSAFYMIATAICLALAALASQLALYSTAIILAYIFFAQPPQLMLQIYSQNYSDAERGTRVSTMFLLSTAVGSIVSLFIGKFLDKNFNIYHYGFGILAVCALVCADVHNKIPSKPLVTSEAGNPWRNISLLWKDKLFGRLVSGYITLGIGTSMIAPLRIEYMANTVYQINATNFQITWISIFIPGLCMVLSTQLWGWIFDKFNFISTRLLINACFMISFLLFFCSTTFYLFTISAIFNGLALGGGMLAWNLWVTKVAPIDKIPAYMSAHTATSGIKGIIAPFLGFNLIKAVGPQSLAIIASSLIVLSSLIFLSAKKNKHIK